MKSEWLRTLIFISLLGPRPCHSGHRQSAPFAAGGLSVAPSSCTRRKSLSLQTKAPRPSEHALPKLLPSTKRHDRVFPSLVLAQSIAIVDLYHLLNLHGFTITEAATAVESCLFGPLRVGRLPKTLRRSPIRAPAAALRCRCCAHLRPSNHGRSCGRHQALTSPTTQVSPWSCALKAGCKYFCLFKKKIIVFRCKTARIIVETALVKPLIGCVRSNWPTPLYLSCRDKLCRAASLLCGRLFVLISLLMLYTGSISSILARSWQKMNSRLSKPTN